MERPIPSYKCISVLHFFFFSFYTLSPIPLRSSIRFLIHLPLQTFCGPVRSLRLPPAIQDTDLLHWDNQHLNVPRTRLPPLKASFYQQESYHIACSLRCIYGLSSFAPLPIPQPSVSPSTPFYYPRLLPILPPTPPLFLENRPIYSHPNFFFPSFCLPFSIAPVTRRSPSKRPKEGPLWPSQGPGHTYYAPIALSSTFTTFYHSHYRQPRKHTNRFGNRRRIVQDMTSRRIPHNTKHKTRKRPTYLP